MKIIYGVVLFFLVQPFILHNKAINCFKLGLTFMLIITDVVKLHQYINQNIMIQFKIDNLLYTHISRKLAYIEFLFPL